MSDEVRWRQTEDVDTVDNCPDHERKYLFYARTYTSHGGFTASRTNDLILNFKMGRDVAQNRLAHRERAIHRFVAEATTFFTNYPTERFAVVPATTSRPRGPDADDRLDRVAELLPQKAANVVAFPVLDTVSRRQPHHEGAVRNVDELVANTRLVPAVEQLADSTRVLVVLDDVLRTGATYESCRRVLTARFPTSQIIGVFWAMAR